MIAGISNAITWLNIDIIFGVIKNYCMPTNKLSEFSNVKHMLYILVMLLHCPFYSCLCHQSVGILEVKAICILVLGAMMCETLEVKGHTMFWTYGQKVWIAAIFPDVCIDVKPGTFRRCAGLKTQDKSGYKEI